MSKDGDESPNTGGLAFFGKMGAHMTHDMRNVFAIIGQNAGLLEDILEAAGRKGPDREGLMKVAASITRSVNKGVEAMERFSRFSHFADKQVTAFDLTSLTENLVALAQRPVSQAGCNLEIDSPGEPVPLNANPFLLQQAIFLSIQLIAEVTDSGEAVCVKLERGRSEATITVIGTAASKTRIGDRVAPVCAILDELDGSLRSSEADGRPSLTISISLG